jgi:hypothetical protein
MLPQIAQGDSNKVWIIPSEFATAMGNIGNVIGQSGDGAGDGASETPGRR